VANKATRNPFQARFGSDSTKKEKEMDGLTKVYQSTQDMLSRQEEQQKAIQKCKSKVHFMTQELKVLQTNTNKERRLEKVSWYKFTRCTFCGPGYIKPPFKC